MDRGRTKNREFVEARQPSQSKNIGIDLTYQPTTIIVDKYGTKNQIERRNNQNKVAKNDMLFLHLPITIEVDSISC